MHPLSGGVDYIRNLAPSIENDIPLYGLSATGLHSNEVPSRSIPEMASVYIQAIRTVQPQGPYRLVGYSSGGLIAYEMANQLLDTEEAIEFLGFIDTGTAPTTVEEAMNLSETDLLFQYLAAHIPENSMDELREVATIGGIDAVIARCHQDNFIPLDVDTPTVRKHLAIAHAMTEATAMYCLPSLPVPVHLFTATERKNSAGENLGPSLGWASLLGHHLSVIPIGGTHSTILESPYVEQLGQAISDALTHTKTDV